MSSPLRFVLASASPRRRELLASLDLAFEVRPAAIDETPLPGERPAAYVARLALEKALAAGRPGELVLAADTTVVLDGEMLAKPEDRVAAEAMLARLAGGEHTVWSGVALSEPASGRRLVATESTRVTIAAMSPDEIRWYAATGEPDDKAGSYAIQGLGALFVESIAGNYTNVVGLPLPTLYRLCTALGVDLRDFRRDGRRTPRAGRPLSRRT